MSVAIGSQMFRFEALRRDGSVERGSLAAVDQERASRVLRDRGLLPIRLHAASARFTASISSADLAAGLLILAELIHAGMPVSQAVSVFGNVAPAGWRTLVPHMAESLRSGASLSSALATIPGAVTPGVLAVVAAGEFGDGLAAGLRRAADLLEQSAATRKAMVSALAYPALLATAGTGSIMLLVGVVIPRFATILSDLGQTLPPASRFLLSAAHVVSLIWLPAGALAVAGVAAWSWWIRTPAGAVAWHEMLLAMPLIGPIRRNAAVARTCASASAMIASGVPLPHAWQLAAEAGGDLALQRRLMTARREIIAGATIWKACAATDAMTSTAVQLIRVGEESGQLAVMLDRAARIHHDQAIGRTRATVRLVEPTLILAFAAIIGGVAAALFQAMYSIRPGP